MWTTTKDDFKLPKLDQLAPPSKWPAGFWIRWLALLLDSLVLAPVMLLNSYAYRHMDFALLLVASLPILIYKPVMEARYGATVGKMICRIRVENEEGSNITLLQAYIRNLPFILYVPLYLILEYQLFHDPSYISAVDVAQRMSVAAAHPMEMVYQLSGVIICIDCVVVAFAQRKRAIHDMIAKSVCVYKKPTAKT